MNDDDTCQRITYAVANGGTTFCGKPAVARTVTGTLVCKEHERWNTGRPGSAKAVREVLRAARTAR